MNSEKCHYGHESMKQFTSIADILIDSDKIQKLGKNNTIGVFRDDT